MNDEAAKPEAATPAGQFIPYWRLEFASTGRRKRGRPAPEPVLREGHARVVHPGPGCVLQGILVDCPAGDGATGWVVLDTAAGTVAAAAPALRSLMIEHAPCQLELVAVPLPDCDGRIRWDWEAYELSPNGPRIRVSE